MKCHLCNATEALIEGDGPAVCYPCVLTLGRIAADPESASDRMLTMLDEMHSAVVTLVRQDNVLSWSWLAA